MRFMVSYKVLPERLDDHATLLAAAFAELAEVRPDGLRYEVHVLPDGLNHVELVQGADVVAALATLPAFQAYRADLEDRCEAPVSMVELVQVHSYDPMGLTAATNTDSEPSGGAVEEDSR